MKKTPGVRKLTGFLFVSAAGTFLHFLYDLTGKHWAAALLSAVNESVWEHMKLIFYPMLLFALAEGKLAGEDRKQLRCSQLAGILLALVLIPAVYYTYTGILGTSADWFNVTIFFLSAGAAYYLQYRLEIRSKSCRIRPAVWVSAIVLIVAAFTAATWFPPRIPLFRDPLTGTYGISAFA